MTGFARSVFAASTFVAAMFLASCGEGGGKNSSLPSQPSQSTGNSPGFNTQPSTAPERLYATSFNLLVFDASANGNVAPLFTTAGVPGCNFSPLGLVGVAVDASGRIFVGFQGELPFTGALEPQVDMFTVSSALVPTFVGKITGGRLNDSWQIAVDSQDHVYVANQTDAISIYAPGPTGVHGAFAVIQGPHTGILGIHGVAVDAAGDIFTANDTRPANILEFAPGSNGDVAPIATISGPNTQLNSPFGIAVDSAGNIYASSAGVDGRGVAVYAKGATGNVAPIKLIRGPNTTLLQPTDVAVGSTGKVYVVDFRSVLGGANSNIDVFAPDANGNVAPIAVIHGPATGFNGEGILNIAVR